MSYIHPALAEHLRKCATRPDAYRWARPGTPEARMPGWLDPWATRVRMKEAAEDEARARAAAEQDAFEREVLALRHDFAKLKLEYELRRFQRKYSPNQPRVPAGSPDGGRWASGGGHNSDSSGRTRLADAGNRAIPPTQAVMSDATPDPIVPGAQHAQDTTRRYSVNLDEEEAPRGIGHTMRQHVGKSDGQLIEKLNEDWRRFETARFEITEYRPAQGSFLSRESANDFVNRTLEDNKETVDRVASGQEERRMMEKRFGYVTGKEAFRPSADEDPYIRDTYGVRVVILHDLRSERGYRVYTAFPINEYVTKK